MVFKLLVSLARMVSLSKKAVLFSSNNEGKGERGKDFLTTREKGKDQNDEGVSAIYNLYISSSKHRANKKDSIEYVYYNCSLWKTIFL